MKSKVALILAYYVNYVTDINELKGIKYLLNDLDEDTLDTIIEDLDIEE